jgi:RNA polymerase sigma-70 factor (ECF subfamily)
MVSAQDADRPDLFHRNRSPCAIARRGTKVPEAMADHADIDRQLRALIPRLQRFAQWLCRDPVATDDLVQTTLERALSRWSERRDPEALRAWLFAILYRQFLDSRRRAKRYAWLLDRIRPGEDVEQPSAEGEVFAQSVLRAFERLPAEQRSLLYCVSVEGLSYRELAEMLDVPIGTVMSRLSRAREALARLSDGDSSTQALRSLK